MVWVYKHYKAKKSTEKPIFGAYQKVNFNHLNALYSKEADLCAETEEVTDVISSDEEFSNAEKGKGVALLVLVGLVGLDWHDLINLILVRLVGFFVNHASLIFIVGYF